MPSLIQDPPATVRVDLTRGLLTGSILRAICLLAATVMSLPGTRAAETPPPAPTVLFRENFSDLKSWRTWEFAKIERATRYDILRDDGNFLLRLEADRSAAGLILARNFLVTNHVQLRWRWRVDHFPDVTDPRERKGDDFALRVYVIFEQDAAEASWLERWVLRNAPFREEGVLPERSLAYAATRINGLPAYYPNPYTDRVVVFPVRAVDGSAGAWSETTVRPVADYRRAFGKEPPRRFRLAVMGDADDSRSRARAWLDYIAIITDSSPPHSSAVRSRSE